MTITKSGQHLARTIYLGEAGPNGPLEDTVALKNAREMKGKEGVEGISCRGRRRRGLGAIGGAEQEIVKKIVLLILLHFRFHVVMFHLTFSELSKTA